MKKPVRRIDSEKLAIINGKMGEDIADACVCLFRVIEEIHGREAAEEWIKTRVISRAQAWRREHGKKQRLESV